jgi:hypothetical protein
MRILACLLLAACVGSSAHAQDTSVADRVAKQNALFEEFYQAVLKNSPERATSVGDDRYNAQLSDESLERIARQHAEDEAFLARLRAISTTGMAETDRLSHEILERQLVRAGVSYELKNYEMPIDQEKRASGFGEALRGLHRAPPPDPPGLEADHRGAARRHEGRPDAAEARRRPVAGTVRGDRLGEPLPAAAEEVSRQLL